MASVCLYLTVLWTFLCFLHAGNALSTQGNMNQHDETGNISTSSPINRRLDTAIGGSVTPSEGEPEPESGSEPQPETEPTSEPESEPTSEPEPTDSPELPPFAEPVPNWEEALPLYGVFWVIHIYILGSLFALLAIYSLVSLIRLRKRRLLSYGYFVALNLLMLVMGLDRAVYFFVDAYNYKSIFPLSVAYMLLGLGFPCLASAFSILFFALLQSTKTRLVSPKVQRGKVLAGIIIFHFTVSIVVDVTVGLFTKAQVLLLLCQGVFLIWGLFLCISYLIIFRRLHKSSVRQFREISRLSMSRRTSSLYGVSPFMKKPRNNWGSAIKVTLFTAVFGVAIGLLQLYGIIVVYGPLGEKVPEPWSWVWYQLAFRICELVMSILMSYVATQPFRYTASGREKPMLMCCTDLVDLVTGRTSHDLQEADDYRLVSGDASVHSQGNEYNKSLEHGILHDQMESLPLHSANLQLPPSNTFHHENTEESLNKNNLKRQVSELDSRQTTGMVSDNNRKNSSALNAEPVNNSVLNNVCIPTSPPTNKGNPRNEHFAPMIQNEFSPGEVKLCNENQNNHHSCPSTPLQRRSGSQVQLCGSHLSLSNLQSSSPEVGCKHTHNDTSLLTSEKKNTGNDSQVQERPPPSADDGHSEVTCKKTQPDNVSAEEDIESRETLHKQVSVNASGDSDYVRRESCTSESTDL